MKETIQPEQISTLDSETRLANVKRAIRENGWAAVIGQCLSPFSFLDKQPGLEWRDPGEDRRIALSLALPAVFPLSCFDQTSVDAITGRQLPESLWPSCSSAVFNTIFRAVSVTELDGENLNPVFRKHFEGIRSDAIDVYNFLFHLYFPGQEEIKSDAFSKILVACKEKDFLENFLGSPYCSHNLQSTIWRSLPAGSEDMVLNHRRQIILDCLAGKFSFFAEISRNEPRPRLVWLFANSLLAMEEHFSEDMPLEIKRLLNEITKCFDISCLRADTAKMAEIVNNGYGLDKDQEYNSLTRVLRVAFPGAVKIQRRRQHFLQCWEKFVTLAELAQEFSPLRLAVLALKRLELLTLGADLSLGATKITVGEEKIAADEFLRRVADQTENDQNWAAIGSKGYPDPFVLTVVLSVLEGLTPIFSHSPEKQRKWRELFGTNEDASLSLVDLALAKGLSVAEPIPERTAAKTRGKLSPSAVLEALKETFPGQEEILESIISAVLSVRTYVSAQTKLPHLESPVSAQGKPNFLFVGPTGSGKSSGIKTVCSEMGIPFALVNISGQTPVGYKGDDLGEYLFAAVTDIARSRNISLEQAIKLVEETGAIFLFDDADKVLFSSNRSETGGFDTGSVQMQKIYRAVLIGENNYVPIGSEGDVLNTRNVSIVFACTLDTVIAKIAATLPLKEAVLYGASAAVSPTVDLTGKKLKQMLTQPEVGVIPEISGRITDCFVLPPVTEADFQAAVSSRANRRNPFGEDFKGRVEETLRSSGTQITVEINLRDIASIAAKQAIKAQVGYRGLAYIANATLAHINRMCLRGTIPQDKLTIDGDFEEKVLSET